VLGVYGMYGELGMDEGAGGMWGAGSIEGVYRA